ncbi:MAG: hypothetical protein WA951_06575 [Leeuwenhoekiella sp.]
MFTLDLKKGIKPTDTLIFSHIGFSSRNILISTLSKDGNIIKLTPENITLDEVVLQTDKIKLKLRKIGRSSKGLGLTHVNFYSYYEKDVDDRLGKEIGMKLNIKRNCHIEALNFNITTNDFKALKFRVHFYKIESGQPSELLVQKDIVFKIEDNFLGWFKVDLKPYEIYLEENLDAVAVTIQWIESVKTDEKSQYFSISTAASPLGTAFYRDKAMDLWSLSSQRNSFYLDALCE